jgi:glutathione S-transferase
MPQPARTVVPGLLRRRVGKMLTLQGTGRHDRAEIYALGAADLAAVAASLRETEFAAADRPTSYDATVYAMLVNILRAPLETPLKVEARRHEILDAYLTRVDQALS